VGLVGASHGLEEWLEAVLVEVENGMGGWGLSTVGCGKGVIIMVTPFDERRV